MLYSYLNVSTWCSRFGVTGQNNYFSFFFSWRNASQNRSRLQIRAFIKQVRWLVLFWVSSGAWGTVNKRCCCSQQRPNTPASQTSPYNTLFMKLLIITVMMLSWNQNSREPNDDLPQIVYILILSPNPSFRSNFRGNGNTAMIAGKNPVSYGKSKVMLQLQSKEKVFWTVVLKNTDRQADRQGQTAALKQGQCLSVRLNSVTPASGSARTIQNRGGGAVGTRSSDLAMFY